ncbi:TOBE domain-containing protein [Mesorhizobium sp. LjRoot246]
MANRIGVISGGRLLQVADPETIYAAPSNHFVARFIGECSILRVAETDGGKGYEIAGARQSLPSRAKEPFDIVVRPENVSIRAASEAASDGAFGVHAIVRDVTYLGAGWRVALELSDVQSLLASIMRGDDVTGRLAPGLPVVARWAPASVAVLPTEGSS